MEEVDVSIEVYRLFTQVCILAPGRIVLGASKHTVGRQHTAPMIVVKARATG